ncbi:MAG: PAS domain S-box protein [Spirochaetales bacterium]|nr:PAS domain S-box protein [Spirochaetales bacterium]
MKLRHLWNKLRGSALYPVIIYALFGILWITLSDYLLLLLIPDRNLLNRIQTGKGWFFIIITSILLLYLIRGYRNRSLSQAIAHRQILMDVPIPLTEISPQGKINYVNRAFTETYGYRREDMPDVDIWFEKAYPDPAYRSHVRKHWEDNLASDFSSGSPSYVFTISDREQKERVVEFFILKGTESLLVICKDMTGERERELEKNQEDKMRALGQLAGGIAHDFNNQLSAIMGYTELIARSLPRENPEFEYLQTIIEAAETSAQLTEELLTFSRKNNREKEKIDLKKMIEDLVHISVRTFPSQYHLEFSTGLDHCHVRGVPSFLMNMILNLLLNARDAMAEGGTISLNLTTSWQRERSLNGLPIHEGNHAILEIGDEGRGIPPENLNQIFEPFFTTKRKDKGTGLGLAMVYSTLQTHHGGVEIENRSPRGTLFRIYLPSHLTIGDS